MRGHGTGTNRDDATGTGAAVLVAAGTSQKDQAEESGGEAGSEYALGAQTVEAGRRSGGCAWIARTSVQSPDPGEKEASDSDDGGARVRRFRTHAGLRVPGGKAPPGSEQGDLAEVDAGGRAEEGTASHRGTRARVARAARLLGRVGAVGHQRT